MARRLPPDSAPSKAVARRVSSIQSRAGGGHSIYDVISAKAHSIGLRVHPIDLRGGDDEETVVTIVEREPEVPSSAWPTDPESDTQ